MKKTNLIIGGLGGIAILTLGSVGIVNSANMNEEDIKAPMSGEQTIVVEPEVSPVEPVENSVKKPSFEEVFGEVGAQERLARYVYDTDKPEILEGILYFNMQAVNPRFGVSNKEVQEALITVGCEDVISCMSGYNRNMSLYGYTGAILRPEIIQSYVGVFMSMLNTKASFGI